MKYSPSRENYIKAVFHLQQESASVTTNSLAAELDAKPASVTVMLQKLKSQKLLLYEKYRGVKLTAQGRKLAVQIIRKHRLWEYFLVNKLSFGWDEVHDLAEELEHVGNTKLIDKLESFLDFPTCDPHGDPIPDKNGKMPVVMQSPVSAMPLRTAGRVNGIADQSSAMLQLLRHKKIGLGTRLEVRHRFGADGSMEIKIQNGPEVNISEHVAKNLLVTYGNR